MENLEQKNNNKKDFYIKNFIYFDQIKFIFKFFVYFFIFLFCIYFFVYYFFIKAPNDFKEGEIINISQGQSLHSISLQLKENNIIKSRIAFETFVIIYGGEKHINVGDYLFKEKLDVYDVAYRIVKGDKRIPMVKITIPEGFTLVDIAELCSLKLENFTKSKFISLAQDKEGYLFPDTYFFERGDDEVDVFSFLQKNFEKKTLDLFKEIDSKKMNRTEIIIMASILEKEAKGDKDIKIISGILWRRLRIGMPLQVDASPITYKNKGLPDKPISNPGILAIRAAMYPENTDYLYYLHDENGEVYFARTFDEHRQNKKKYLR